MTNHNGQKSSCTNGKYLTGNSRCEVVRLHKVGEVLWGIASTMALLVTLTGCSTIRDITEIEEVKPWQRGSLARDDMQLTTDALHQSVDDHIYFSKEASTGGSNVQGGGCGCN